MSSKVFFSWQSDTPNRVGRSFLEAALTAALAVLAQDDELEEADRDLELDRDTKGVAGSPPLVATIFGKIDTAAAIVCDMTFVSARAGEKKSPNPNVLIEYGWALKSRGHGRVLSVMNAAYGPPSEVTLPFDMRHLRFPITYDLPADASSERKAAEQKSLTARLVDALKPILTQTELSTVPAAFLPRASGISPGRWRGSDAQIGFLNSTDRQVPSPKGSLMWLRMWPGNEQQRIWTIAELRKAVWEDYVIRPFLAPTGGFDSFREDGVFGAVTRGSGDDPETGFWSSAVFETGEIWGMDGLRMDFDRTEIPFDPECWEDSAGQFWGRLQALGVVGPILWEAGFENCRGRRFRGGRAPCVKEIVRVEGRWGGGGAEEVIRQIFQALRTATT